MGFRRIFVTHLHAFELTQKIPYVQTNSSTQGERLAITIRYRPAPIITATDVEPVPTMNMIAIAALRDLREW